MSQKDKKSQPNVVMLQIILTFAGTLLVAYLGYLGIQTQVETPIHTTQTAEARQITVAKTPIANTISSNIPIAISSKKGWQSTDIHLNIGDKVEISVIDGKWTPNSRLLPDDEKKLLGESYNGIQIFVNAAYVTNGEGSSSTCNELNWDGCPIPDENWGKLIARVGLNEPFGVGSQDIFIATFSGILELRINEKDSSLDNDFGVLAIIINVEQP